MCNCNNFCFDPSHTPAGVAMETSPQTGSLWGKTCGNCGNGQNLKLDPSTLLACSCQRDGIRVDSDRLSWLRSKPPPASDLLNQSLTLSDLSQSLPDPVINPVPPSMPKPLQVDQNRLVTSVYTKSQKQGTLNRLQPSLTRGPTRAVLKYTDTHIHQPDISVRLKHEFPQLVGGYIKRKPQRPLPAVLETLKQSKVSMVAHSNTSN